MQPQYRYTYEQAGFNGFMLRSLKSNPGAQTLAGGISTGNGGTIAFDRQAIEGSLGGILKVGRVQIDGIKGRIVFLDDTETVENGWAGDLTS